MINYVINHAETQLRRSRENGRARSHKQGTGIEDALAYVCVGQKKAPTGQAGWGEVVALVTSS